jgi:hypothetical protein
MNTAECPSPTPGPWEGMGHPHAVRETGGEPPAATPAVSRPTQDGGHGPPYMRTCWYGPGRYGLVRTADPTTLPDPSGCRGGRCPAYVRTRAW